MRVLPLAVFFSTAALAGQVEEIQITATRDTSVLYTDDTLVSSADTASMLRRMPGANTNKSGELTGIAQYRGMYGDRIDVAVNGSNISPGGPNAMDAPLHYAPVAILESLTITRGITPVSLAQESIGGHMSAQTYTGTFGVTDDFTFQSRLYAGSQTNNDAVVASLFAGLANQYHLLRASVMQESANDSDAANVSLLPSSYERDRFDLGYGYQDGAHEFSVDFALNNTGSAGTAALPMDILSIDSSLWRSSYQYDAGSYRLQAKVAHNELEHWMTNYHLRRPPQGNTMVPAAMQYRRTFASGSNDNFGLQLELPTNSGVWRFGVDGSLTSHTADISNPNAAPFFINNFNDAQRNIVGIFAEREMEFGNQMGLEAGIRINQVRSDAAPVQANLNPANMSSGMPVMMNMLASQLATRFNNQDLQQKDLNADWFMKWSVQSDNNAKWSVALARKTRSPSYQERYLWLPLEATGGLADGLTYVGSAQLQPEVAHELEVALDINTHSVNFYPRVFYRRINDYIQGVPSTDMQVVQFAQLMANMGMGRAGPLQFMNTDAAIYGADLEAVMHLNSQWQLRTNAALVRGERTDTDDNLYRIAPDNLLFALDYSANRHSASLEAVIYRKQGKVSLANSEQATAGYAVLNAAYNIQLKSGLELRAGIDNLLDRNYLDHLAASNRAYNPDLASFARMPGLGRNVFFRFIWNTY